MTIDQLRIEFEAHIRIGRSADYTVLVLQRNDRDQYSTTWVQAQWQGWQDAFKIAFARGWNECCDTFRIGAHIVSEPQ
jgi:hypothetical protein